MRVKNSHLFIFCFWSLHRKKRTLPAFRWVWPSWECDFSSGQSTARTSEWVSEQHSAKTDVKKKKRKRDESLSLTSREKEIRTAWIPAPLVSGETFDCSIFISWLFNGMKSWWSLNCCASLALLYLASKPVVMIGPSKEQDTKKEKPFFLDRWSITWEWEP